ncbi:MAG: HAMP domain-containing protein [Rhodocyclaceae bacterium]|nr:HAMP domain-containing protein [Rhodocyclaceae bacterium]MBX3670571.1 HAMP domain-containing protein [Rhodocyclaceae bacterium]
MFVKASALVPESLLWRTFLVLASLMMLSVLAWSGIYAWFEREPRARETAQVVASIVNLTRAALLASDTQRRYELLRDMAEREAIRIYPVENGEATSALPPTPTYRLIESELKRLLGPLTRVAGTREGVPGFYVSFLVSDSENEPEPDEYWLQLRRERLEPAVALEWLGWAAAALLLALGGAYLLVWRVTHPLRDLAVAARQIGRGKRAIELPEQGPTELVELTRAFNQMSADLRQLDADRALILAGISHDLRTPLTRLTLGIEMSAADEFMADSMRADIEEMDRVIGQFLDFAREDGGEPAVELDAAELVQDLAAQYQRRGLPVLARLPPSAPKLCARPLALRRVLANLVDNAVRYAGTGSNIEIALAEHGAVVRFEVLDRGPGIPPDKAEIVKRPFTRLEQARTGATGAGLGLAIVDRVVHAHAGSFELLPREGGGLCARISLPAVATRRRMPARPAA